MRNKIVATFSLPFVSLIIAAVRSVYFDILSSSASRGDWRENLEGQFGYLIIFGAHNHPSVKELYFPVEYGLQVHPRVRLPSAY